MFSCIGFLIIPSIATNKIFPPSKGGTGNRFVTPNDTDISAKIYINCDEFSVFTTTSEIPTGPVNWSTPTFPVNSSFTPSTIDVENSTVSQNP